MLRFPGGGKFGVAFGILPALCEGGWLSLIHIIVRHRITRLIRESYRLHEDMFNSGLDMVVIARVSAKDRSMREIESALLHLGKLQGVLKEE